MNEDLRERVADELENIHNAYQLSTRADCLKVADAILALFASSLVKAQREAFVAGAGWSDAHEPDEGMSKEEIAGIDMDEAIRRYPDA